MSDRDEELLHQVVADLRKEGNRLREQLNKYRGGMNANIQNRKERGLLTEEEQHLIGEIEILREQLKDSQSAYEKLSRLFNELEKSQNEACKQLRVAREAVDEIAKASYEIGYVKVMDGRATMTCADGFIHLITIARVAQARLREMEEK